MRLMEKLTNGASFEIGYTGTSVLFKPGSIVGGRVSHDCGLLRSNRYDCGHHAHCHAAADAKIWNRGVWRRNRIEGG
jgi:hypothetical protein